MTIGVGALKSTLGKVGKGIKNNFVQVAIPVAICAPAIYGAYNLKYDKSANPVQGKNIDCALSETGKQIKKYAGMSAILGITTGLTAIAPLPLKPVVFVLGNFVALTKYNEAMEEILPSEEKLVAQACKDKGIDYNQESPLGTITSPEGAVA